MEIRQYLTLIQRWFWLLVLGAVLSGTAAFLISRAQPPVYRATATLLITQGDVTSTDDFSAIRLSERLAQSYIQRLTNYKVLEQSLANLGIEMTPDALERRMYISLINKSQLIELSVEHTNPQTAAALANEIPAVFAQRNTTQQLERFASSKSSLEEELNQLQTELATAETELATAKDSGADQTTTNRLTDNILRLRDTYSRLLQSYEDIRIAEARGLNNIIIDEDARAPAEPVRPQVLATTILATAVGTVLVLGLIVFIDYLDDTVKDPEKVEQTTGLSVIGTISHFAVSKPADALVLANQPRAPISEAYRQLRTNIQYVSISRELKTILVTSAHMAEGKTTSAANLAIALTQAGNRVILIDADMRRPALHRVFQIPNSKGLTNLLLCNDTDASFVQATKIKDLSLVPSGPLPPNPAELLGSGRMKEVTAWLAQQADYVIFDSPPILVVTDSALLAQLVDTTLVVANAAQTRYQVLAAAGKRIAAVDGHIAGVLLNRVNPKDSAYHYYHNYRYQYEYRHKSRGRTLADALANWLPFSRSR